MEFPFLITAAVVALALLFSFTNGFNDTASQVATVISSCALTPETALVLAAVGNFIGAYFLGTNVAQMIGKGIVDPLLVQSSKDGIFILMSAIIGASIWNISSWYFGIPSSSSHALIGGILGSFIAGWGIHPVQWINVKNIVIVMFLAPTISFILTYLFTKIIFVFAEILSPKANPFFKGLQVITLILQSLAHGTNDAQKTMGIITFALIIMQFYHPPAGEKFIVPAWVVLSCSTAMALGVVMGGWRIIRTLGGGLYRVRTIHSFTSQTSSALIMYLVSLFGFPVSTTQVISSSIMGAGAAFRPKSVRWDVAMDLAMAWLITIPVSALIALGTFKLTKMLFL